MKVTDIVEDKIERLPYGYVFTYEDFIGEVEQREAIIKALNRMVKSGKISKLSKGKYFKPEQTAFGALQPDQYQVVKDLLEDDGKRIGYLTGLSIYNQMGFTTQVGHTIQIGKNHPRSKFQRGRYTIICIRQKNTITTDNIPLLQLLDIMRFIKKIPDTSIIQSCRRLKSILSELPKKELERMIRLSGKYPPSVRALLGSLLDTVGREKLTGILLENLNPITTYDLPGANDVLDHTDKWNIV